MKKRLIILTIAALVLANIAGAEPFPTPAYTYALTNVSPDTKAIAEVFPKGAALDREDYHARYNRWDMVTLQGRRFTDTNMFAQLYGVQDCDAVALALPAARAALDALGLSYMPEPAMAKTVRTYFETFWHGETFVYNDAGELIWVGAPFVQDPPPKPRNAYHEKYCQQAIDGLGSPEDVVFRFRVALDGLPLSEYCITEPQDGVWQTIIVVVTPQGGIEQISLQNAKFDITKKSELTTPLLGSDQARALALNILDKPRDYTFAEVYFASPDNDRRFLALSDVDQVDYGYALTSVMPCYALTKGRTAQPAWACEYADVWILDGVRQEPASDSRSVLYLSAVDGSVLDPYDRID